MKPYPFSNYPLGILLKKPFSKGKEKLSAAIGKLRTERQELRGLSDTGAIRSYISSGSDPAFWAPSCSTEERETLLRAYRRGCFDILGSGWIHWGYDIEARGLEGWFHDHRVFHHPPSRDERVGLLRKEHRDRAAMILDMLADDHYPAIDHQRDLKSGFRWDESLASQGQARLHKGVRGADPKVPFELGRFQHLPRMALLSKEGMEGRKEHIRAFRDQVLDFIAMNPPGMGIQWSCSMDVGIRTANLLLAYDLFRSIDEEGVLDEDFRRCFSDSIVRHADHLEGNLEYQDGLTGNHYLFNIAGLLFASAYMPEAPGSDRRMGFAVQETVRELFKQFFPAGGNFEGATAYHRLSTEMFVYTTALILGSRDRLKKLNWDRWIPLSKWSHGISGKLRSTADRPLPEAYIERLQRVMEVNEEITKPDGDHARVGDNDSGVLFRLSPQGSLRTGEELNALYVDRSEGEHESSRSFDEDLLSMKGTNAAINGFREGSGEKMGFEEWLVRAFMADSRPAMNPGSEKLASKRGAGKDEPQVFPYRETQDIPFPNTVDLSQGGWYGDPEVGWFVFRAPELFLLVNAPPGDALRHTWGHVHNDRTGLELQVLGEDLLLDPGSYVYEALPEWRNAFRSTWAHNVPIVKGKEEQNRWRKGGKGLFTLYPESRCTLLKLEERSIRVKCEYRGIEHVREVRLHEEGIHIQDHCDHPFQVNFAQKELHAKGYGKRLKKSPL